MTRSEDSLEHELLAARRAVDSDPNDVDAWQRLGRVQVRLDAIDDARVSYERALALDPRNPWTMLYLGNLHYYRRAYGEALRAFERARDFAPDLAQPFTCLADVFRRLGEDESADAMYRKACEVDPEDAIARQALENWRESRNHG